MLHDALQQNNRLPAVLLVITSNTSIDDKVSTPFHTKRIWNALCLEIDRALKARKNDLPRKAFLNEEPRVYFSNIYLRYKDHCEDTGETAESFKTKRRRLNNILPQVLSKFSFDIININGIIPEKEEYFIASTGLLSGKGLEAFWTTVSKELRLHDEKVKEKFKDKIINSFFAERDEYDRIQREKDYFRNRRFSTPKTFPKRDLDQGDGKSNQNRFDRSNKQ